MMANQQEITPQNFANTMGQLKRKIAQVQGETQQMQADSMSETMNQIMSMVNQVFAQAGQKDAKINELQTELDKCYNAHPELKISAEADKKKPKK